MCSRGLTKPAQPARVNKREPRSGTKSGPRARAFWLGRWYPTTRNAFILELRLMPRVVKAHVTCVSDNCPVRVAVKQIELTVARILADRQTAGRAEYLPIYPMRCLTRGLHRLSDLRKIQKPRSIEFFGWRIHWRCEAA